MGAKVEIATIHFGYRNGKVIKMLKERGMMLQRGQLEGIPKLEIEINRYLIFNKDQVKSPCTAFITFTTS
jgi:hypothetical protein